MWWSRKRSRSGKSKGVVPAVLDVTEAGVAFERRAPE